MKYLKLYEELSSDILQDVKDILLEWNDSGDEIRLDWVDSRYKRDVIITIKNRKSQLDSDTFIRLFSYMKENKFECNYISCHRFWPISEDKIYVNKHNPDFGFDKNIESINSWSYLEIVFHRVI